MASTDLPATELRPTLIQQIAGNVLGVAAAAIPLEVVEHTKALIFDSIGCALAAAEEPAFARASRVFAQLGGNPDCTVIGSSRRVNLPQAVLLNGILIRSLDLNDAYIGPGQMGHPSDNIAVALCVGEKFRASGLGVIASVALGYEIYCPQVVKLGGERVPPEALGPDEFAAVVHPTAAEIERDGRKARPGEPIAQRREPPPILESLEAVDDDDRRPRGVAAGGADVDQHVAEGARELVPGKSWSRHGVGR
jgi:hypothetical protein